MALSARPLRPLERGLDPRLEEASRGFGRLVKQIRSIGAKSEKWTLDSGVNAKMQDLQRYLPQILSLLWSLQLEEEKMSSLGAGLREAKEACYDLDDLLDEMEYYRLKVKLAETKSKVSSCNPLIPALKLGNMLVSSTPREASQFLKCLDFITSKARNLIALLEKARGVPSDLPLAAPYFAALDASAVLLEDHQKVFGRDKELNNIVGMLTEPPSHCDQPPLEVIPIVGIGGIGKTTLARLVYDDARVKQHFDLRAWALSSERSDKVKVTEEILRSANPPYLSSIETEAMFEKLQLQLREFLMGKRFLLVLDDVRDEPLTFLGLQEIICSLRAAGRGSKILVTTRTETVGDMLAASRVYNLDALHVEDCWSLIKESTLGSPNTNDPTDELEQVGKKIAAKLSGLPLAAKLLAGLLKGSKSMKDWSSILDIEFDGDVTLSLLQLSYNCLPGQLKQCFALCSIFAKDWKFEKGELIRMWMANGLIQPQTGADKRMEDLGTDYFNVLLSRSFFQGLGKGSKTQYWMHDLIHDMAVSVSSYDCNRTERDLVCDIPSTVRHVSAAATDGLQHLNKLRSLVLMTSFSFSTSSFKDDLLFSNIRSLRYLDLSHFHLKELPETIGDLWHLRYLSLSGTLQRLPESVCKLHHLQSLHFTGKCSLDKLPDGTSMLVNLRHLGIDTRYLAEMSNIGQLVNLQGSLEFHVKKLKGHTLEELRNINSLRGQLFIKGLDNVVGKKEARKAKLCNKRNLKVLKLEWASAGRTTGLCADSEIVESLQPHSNLKELHIRRYLGATAPSWLQLPLMKDLQSLHLTNCRSLNLLPPLGLLPSLKQLHMKELCTVNRIGYEFYGTDKMAFPALRDLVFDDFPSLLEWSAEAKGKPFPCLKKLKLIDCPKLDQLPSFPHSVTEVTVEHTRLISYMRLAPLSLSKPDVFTLDIRRTNLLVTELFHQRRLESVVVLNVKASKQFLVAEGLQPFTSLQRLQLSHSDLTDQNLSVLLQALPFLSSLEMIHLPNIVSLLVPTKIRLCTTLTELKICSCPMVSSLASLDILVSLRCLVVENCPKLTAASFPKGFSTLTKLKVLSISYCKEFQSLPTGGLPTSLETLHLVGCHTKLTERLPNYNGNSLESLYCAHDV